MYQTRIREVNKIEGADKIVSAEVAGYCIITSRENEGKKGILFTIDEILTDEFTRYGNLYRDKDKNYDNTQAGYFEDKPRIRPIKLKGIKCDAFFLTDEAMIEIANNYYKGEEGKENYVTGIKDITEVGDNYWVIFNTKDGQVPLHVCSKYRPQSTVKKDTKKKESRDKIKKVKQYYPLFREHYDTPNVRKVFNQIPPGTKVYITDKLHGTSVRFSATTKRKRTIVNKVIDFISGIYSIFTKIKFMNIGVWAIYKLEDLQKVRGYSENIDLVVGSRRVIKDYEKGFYWDSVISYLVDSDLDLPPFLTFYGEIVGYEGTKPIQSHSIAKLEKFLSKEEYKKYKEIYTSNAFSYGVEEGKYKIYIYRIAAQTPDYEYDLPLELQRQICNKLGFSYVSYSEGDKENKENYKEYIVPNTLEEFLRDMELLYMNKLVEYEKYGHIPEGFCILAPSIYVNDCRYLVCKYKGRLFEAHENLIDSPNLEDNAA